MDLPALGTDLLVLGMDLLALGMDMPALDGVCKRLWSIWLQRDCNSHHLTGSLQPATARTKWRAT